CVRKGCELDKPEVGLGARELPVAKAVVGLAKFGFTRLDVGLPSHLLSQPVVEVHRGEVLDIVPHGGIVLESQGNPTLGQGLVTQGPPNGGRGAIPHLVEGQVLEPFEVLSCPELVALAIQLIGGKDALAGKLTLDGYDFFRMERDPWGGALLSAGKMLEDDVSERFHRLHVHLDIEAVHEAPHEPITPQPEASCSHAEAQVVPAQSKSVFREEGIAKAVIQAQDVQAELAAYGYRVGTRKEIQDRYGH